MTVKQGADWGRQSGLRSVVASGHLRALRAGTTWAIPYLMVWSVVQILSGIAPSGPWTPVLVGTGALLSDLFPVVVTANVSAMLALEVGLPRMGLAIAGEVALVPVLAGFQVSGGDEARRALGTVVALVLPFVVVPLVRRLARLRWLRMMRIGSDANTPAEAINLVGPTLVVALGGVGAAMVVAVLPWQGAGVWAVSVMEQLPAPAAMVLYIVMNSLLWSVGISGYYVLLPLLGLVQQTGTGGSLLGAFVFLGGSGATAGLVVAVLLHRRHRLRSLALASIVPAVFNVNEPVLFGFPVVFNPRLFFPFVLAPLANLGLARVAVDLGWVHIERTDVPFNLPVLVSAWLVSGGELAAVALQVAAVAVSTVVYYPFVGRFGAALVGSESVLRQVDEEIDHRIGDPLGPLLKGSWGRDDARRRIAAVARSDLVLSYQPKVARDSGEVVGVEALLRIASDDGGRATPGGWLKDVARSGLSVDTDLWVLDRVHRQLVAWRDHQDAPAIAMNLAVDSLRSQRVLDALVAVAEAFPGRLSVEITEEGLLAHDDVSGAAIERLAQAGIRTFIDDFGTGFSGLSYLRRYRVDGIKIDREFTAGLGAPRGRELFEEMCTLAQRLDLDVVVEGVEEDWQLVHVPAGRGIAVQGWLYAPALEPDEVLDFVRARRPRPRPSWVHDRA